MKKSKFDTLKKYHVWLSKAKARLSKTRIQTKYEKLKGSTVEKIESNVPIEAVMQEAIIVPSVVKEEIPKEIAVEKATEPIVKPKEEVNAAAEFIFRMPDGEEVGRAKDLGEFIENIKKNPLDCIIYHTRERHFSPWLKLLGYKKLAKKAKNIHGESEKIRENLLKLISRYRQPSIAAQMNKFK